MSPDQVRALLALIPTVESLPAAPRRLILHWNAGGPQANSIDKQHYHWVVNQNCTLSRGDHPISANMRALGAKDAYAAHTGGFNSFSVGYAFAGMLNSAPGFRHGPHPLTSAQVDYGLTFAGLSCRRWNLDPLNPAHLFTHYEAWSIHRVKGTMNDQKWDINELSFLPNLGRDEVGPYLRKRTKELTDAALALLNDPKCTLK